jgi:hypothetical protein
MTSIVYYAVVKHLKERRLTFDLIAFQLGLDNGQVAVALMELFNQGCLEVEYMKNGEPVFSIKKDDEKND